MFIELIFLHTSRNTLGGLCSKELIQWSTSSSLPGPASTLEAKFSQDVTGWLWRTWKLKRMNLSIILNLKQLRKSIFLWNLDPKTLFRFLMMTLYFYNPVPSFTCVAALPAPVANLIEVHTALNWIDISWGKVAANLAFNNAASADHSWTRFHEGYMCSQSICWRQSALFVDDIWNVYGIKLQ